MSQEKESVQREKQPQIKQYRCFCAKNYNSYAGLYLHLKSKHEEAFSLYKNMKISKLLTPVITEPSKVVFKLKEPPKETNEGNQSESEKVQILNGPCVVQQESHPLFWDQQFYAYRPQQAQSHPISYYPVVPSQQYMVPSQPYYTNPVRDYSVSNQPMSFSSHHPYSNCQYQVHMQPQQPPAAYGFPSQPISNPYFVGNGLQYWVGAPYSQPMMSQRPLDRRQVVRYSGNDYMTVSKPSGEKAAKQKNRAQQKKVKPQPKYLNFSEDSNIKKFTSRQTFLSSEPSKTAQDGVQ